MALASHRRGVARFFKGGGGHTVSNIIVMAFSPRNIVGCLLKKGLQRGVTGTPGPALATPLHRCGPGYIPGPCVT